jgi:hypothetical protein
VKETGISFDTFACLAKCQGLGVQAIRASDSSLDNFRQVVKQICASSSSSNGTHPTSFLIVSYTRKVLGQTGTGHFSPIGAYDEASDSVLLLDTARFKYGPHWVKVELLFEALTPLDPSTGKSRGFMILSYDGVDEKRDCCERKKNLSHLPLSIVFKPKNSSPSVKEYKEFIKAQQNRSDEGEIDFNSVVSFWTQDNTNATYVRELVQPQLRPVDADGIQMVESIQELIKAVICSVDEAFLCLDLGTHEKSCVPGLDHECCNSTNQSLSQRFIQVTPMEMLFVVYLASISKEASQQLIVKSAMDDLKCDDTVVVEQLLAEVSLISNAIETSDLEL